MSLRIDARIPLVFGAAAMVGPDDAALLDGDAQAPEQAAAVGRYVAEAGHVAGCLCCLPRGAVARALGALFLARARGEIPFFRRVVVIAADPEPVRLAALGDAVVSARFRLA